MTSEALKALDLIESDYDLLTGNWTPDPRPLLATIRAALYDINPTANSESGAVSEPVQKTHKLPALPTQADVWLDVDALAQEIRRVDGNHSLGAGALADALMPFLRSRLTQKDEGQ